MTGNYGGINQENLTAAVAVIVLDVDRVDLRVFCCGGGGGPAVAESSAAVAASPGGQQDPAAVLAAVRRCVDNTVAAGGWVTGAHARMMAARVVAVAVANRHRGSVVAWNRCTGEPLGHAIPWSDDAATLPPADDGQRGRSRRRRGRGQPSVACESTIGRLIERDAAVREAHRDGQCFFGTIDSWIVWNLTGGVNGGVFAIDPSANAAFASLAQSSPPQWNEEPLAVLGISPESLPNIKPSCALYGYFSDGPLRETPISGVVGYRRQSSANGRSETATNAPSHHGDGDRRLDRGEPVNALERLTASIRESMESASAAARVEIVGDHCGVTTKVPPSLRPNPPPAYSVLPTTLTEDIIKDDDREEAVKTPAMSFPVVDFPETDPRADEPRHDGDMCGDLRDVVDDDDLRDVVDDDDLRGPVDDGDLSGAVDGIASEKPTTKKWTIGATVAAVGVGALLAFGGYKWLTRK